MKGFSYKLWDEKEVNKLCKAAYPEFWPTYKRLQYKIQKVDMAKYMIADASSSGSWVIDLDVLPKHNLDVLLKDDAPYIFDRCSRKNIIANDIFYVGPGGLPGILDYCTRNLERVNNIDAYNTRKMRYIFQTTGPDFFTRYLKQTGLSVYTLALSDRTFLEARERHRDVKAKRSYVDVIHHLSWVDHVR